MDAWYFWTPGSAPVRLDFVGTDFNDHGVVVGSTAWCCDPSAKAVRWSPALGLQEIGDGIALGINNTGEIVGSSFGTTGAWKWTAEGGTQHLLAAGRPASGANDINESGEIVGSDGNVWRWRPNEVVGEPVTDVSSYSARINNHGQITGQLAYE